jgi:hypothetical protein
MRAAAVWGLMGAWFTTGCVVSPPYEDSTGDTTDTSAGTDSTDTTEPTASGLKILVLDDSAGSAASVADALEALGHNAVLGPAYNDWTGENPRVSNADAVLVLQGDKTDAPLTAGASQALVAASQGGAGIVRSGLAARIAASVATPSNADLALPIEDEASASTDSEWWVLQRGHAIADGLSSKWTETGRVYGTSVKGDLDIQVIAEARGSFGAWPALVVREPAVGPRQVYVNSTFGGDGSSPSVLNDTLLDNAVRWAAGDL